MTIFPRELKTGDIYSLYLSNDIEEKPWFRKILSSDYGNGCYDVTSSFRTIEEAKENNSICHPKLNVEKDIIGCKWQKVTLLTESKSISDTLKEEYKDIWQI